MPYQGPLLGRFLAKLIFDILPAALASVIGGLLFTHYQLGRAPEPVAARIAPASAEMMQLLRDEHALIVNVLKAQLVNEKMQFAADEAAPGAAADAPPIPMARRPTVVMTAAKPAAPRGRTLAAAAPPQSPLPIVPEQPAEGATLARDRTDSLLARTIGIRDHVVAVTQRVVSAIGGIPSWIGAIGDHIGGEGNPRPPAELVSAS